MDNLESAVNKITGRFNVQNMNNMVYFNGHVWYVYS